MRTIKGLWMGSLVAVLGLGLNARAADEKITHESMMKEFISILKDSTKAMAGVSDNDTAKAAVKDLDKQTARTKKLTQQAKGLGKPPKDVAEKLKKFEQEAKEAGQGFQKEAFALQKKLQGNEISTENKQGLGKALIQFGQAMMAFSKAATGLGK
jgi:hypothetical protein